LCAGAPRRDGESDRGATVRLIVPAVTVDEACSLLETALKGQFRQEIVSDAATSTDLRKALLRLRDAMRSNLWKTGAHQINLDTIVRTYDNHTRQDGFHVLHDWDGIADKVNEDTIPVDVLHYLIDKRGVEQPDSRTIAILLDYYFVHLLALVSLRIWDEGDADDHLDRLNKLLGDLQGPHGSGQHFVTDAETLILIATSHFEIVERGYGKLLARVKTLSRPHQTKIAAPHTASIGSHLRFGFEATYARDTVAMRSDNAADYPWLCFALVAAMREYARMRDEHIEGQGRERMVEAILNGLSPDARAFVGTPPASLSKCEAERAEFRELFHRCRSDLLEEFERFRPSPRMYSPLSFFFNFSHNVLKGTVVDALLRGNAWKLSFNDLLTGVPPEEADGASKIALATTLMGYARSNPSPIRGRLMPVIVYDPASGHEAFTVTMRKIKENA
jgi:hypothetical protein